MRLGFSDIYKLPRNDISIHASHAGCDSPVLALQHVYSGFQSTHPMRDATSTTTFPPRRVVFQSTHPMRDATATVIWRYRRSRISIHASHAGCDLPANCCRTSAVFLFQSTHPMRDATRSGSLPVNGTGISIHASHAGCDSILPPILPPSTLFQSTHPMRDATLHW